MPHTAPDVRQSQQMVLAAAMALALAVRISAVDIVTAAPLTRQKTSNSLGGAGCQLVTGGENIMYVEQGLISFDFKNCPVSCIRESGCAAVTTSCNNGDKFECGLDSGICASCNDMKSTLAVSQPTIRQEQHRRDQSRETTTIKSTISLRKSLVSTLIGEPNSSRPSTFVDDPVATSHRKTAATSIASVSRSSTSTNGEKSASSRAESTSASSQTDSTTSASTVTSSGPAFTLIVPTSSSTTTSGDTSQTSGSSASPTSSESAIPDLPQPTALPPQKGLSQKNIGIIVVCSVAAFCVIFLLVGFLRKWLLSRRRKQQEAAARGLLFGPRHEPPCNKRPSETSDVTIENKAPTIGDFGRGKGSAVRPRFNTAGLPLRSTQSTPPPKRMTSANRQNPAIQTPEATELSTFPPSIRHSATTTRSNSIISPVSMFAHTAATDRNSSPPFTATHTPLSPLFPRPASTPAGVSPRPVFGSTHAPADSAPSRPGAERLNDFNGHMLKSSTMSHQAGPYLTAEKALGEGYWQAEREQREADMAIGKGDEAGVDVDESKDSSFKTSDAAKEQLEAESTIRKGDEAGITGGATKKGDDSEKSDPTQGDFTHAI